MQNYVVDNHVERTGVTWKRYIEAQTTAAPVHVNICSVLSNCAVISTKLISQHAVL